MNTIKVRWLGNKKSRTVDLPIGLSAIGEKTGEVVCNPVGEFPANEAAKLLSLPGASSMFVPEDEYQAAHGAPAQKEIEASAPAANVKMGRKPMSEAHKQALRDRFIKMNEAKAAKKAAALAAKRQSEPQVEQSSEEEAA